MPDRICMEVSAKQKRRFACAQSSGTCVGKLYTKTRQTVVRESDPPRHHAWGAQLRSSLKPLEYHGNILYREHNSTSPIMLGDVRLSDNQ